MTTPTTRAGRLESKASRRRRPRRGSWRTRRGGRQLQRRPWRPRGTARVFERAVGFDASREEHRGGERCARNAPRRRRGARGRRPRRGSSRDADASVGSATRASRVSAARAWPRARSAAGTGARAGGGQEASRRRRRVGTRRGARPRRRDRGGDGRGRRGRGDGRVAAAVIVVVVPEETPRVVGRHANGRHARRGVVVGGGRARPIVVRRGG